MRFERHNRHLAVFVQADYEEMSLRAAKFLHARLRDKGDLLLCAATGGTPTRAYDLAAEEWKARPAITSRLRVLKLDEWGGLPQEDPGTCECYLRRHVLEPLRIGPERYAGFRCNPPDPDAECERVASHLDEQGPIDLCVLGLGVNGHLGFNEPADVLHPHAHVAKLSAASLAHPMVRENPGAVKYGMTLGMGDILCSRVILLLVSGPHKRGALRRLLSGEITTQFPASLLWLHPSVTCICDADAAE